VLGKAKEPKRMTNECTIKVIKGKAEYAPDKSVETYWNSGTMTITLPKNKTVDGILIKWYSSQNDYTLKSYSKNGKVLDSYNGADLYFLHQYYTIDDNATKVVIKLKKNKKSGYGIATLRVYEKGKVGVSVERWERPKTNQCDLLVISCHRDDELLYFGGTIPYYQSVKGKTVYTVYMSGNDRPRVREALAGQWAMGTKSYPIFMGFAGGYHNGVSGTIKDWGGENYCLKKLVEKIRKYHPDVIVTHDTNGEYGHPSHKATSYLVEKAVKLAGDKTKFKESYKKYGVCKVKKLYKHYTNTNKIYMNWNISYPELYGKSPIQVATIGFDKHQSQQPKWSMTCKAVKQCPNNQFGLVYTRVGKDKKKNDFFENID
jgi:LmbE family N-acetylglucosaminyl deacetylase